MICSITRLDFELIFITHTLCNNAYHLGIVQLIIKYKNAEFNKVQLATVQRCHVYLRFPWLCNISDRCAKRVSLTVLCYYAADTHVFFTAEPVLPSLRKVVLPPRHNSSLIYSLKCRCGLHYIRRTTQRLDVRIRHRVTTVIRNLKYTLSDILTNKYGSFIAELIIAKIVPLISFLSKS